jgi:signal transduction histidine kinase
MRAGAAGRRLQGVRQMSEPPRFASAPEVAAPVEQAIRRIRFLAEVSQHLAKSLDLDVTIKTVSELAVPYLADWCIVARASPMETNDRHLVWQIVAATHVDRNKAKLAHIVAEQAVLAAGGSAGALPHVEALVALGQAVVLRGTSEEELRAIAPDESLRGGILALGAATMVVVPLRAHAETIGALVLGTADLTRSYDSIDLALVEDVAHRAALAIENASLYQRARDAVQQRDAFLSIVSHDLKNSLALISGYVQYLQREVSQENLQRDRIESQLSLIKSAVSNMSTELEQLVEVPMLASGKRVQLNRELLDLVPLIYQIVADYASTAKQHRIQCTANPDRVVGQWDKSRLESVFNNLLSNAVKYSPRGGEVRVSITSEQAGQSATAVISIADQGVGIPREDLPHIFDMFHRASNVRSRFRGTGLGLPSVRSIIEQHGGRVDVSSTLGSGSTFVIRLPIQ